MSASYTSISPDKLSHLTGTAAAPALIDVCLDEDFSADPRLIPCAVRRSPFYRWCRDATKETHNWPTNKVR